ncbi:O-sialoglycoprotein endopeptidase, partial [Globisporangium splendens]
MLRIAVAVRHRHRSAPVPALLEECRKRRLPYILGIETSCDDTAVAVLDRDGNVLSNVISSQWELNAKWKGIVPALAARAHQENLPHVIAASLEQSGLDSVEQLKAIAVTSGPGLSPCLDVGLIAARDLCIAHPSVDFLQINHLEGIGSYELLGNTLDDSVGEAFDKVARMLELTSSGKGGVHGGRLIEEMASRGNDRAFDFPEPMKHRKFGELDEKTKEDLCASFQRRAIDQLLTRARRACQWGKERLRTDITSIVVCGGVASNQYLRRRMEHVAAEEGVRAIFPPAKYCTDNGVMIAWAGLERHELGMRSDPVTARYTPRWPLDTLTPVRPSPTSVLKQP